MPIKNYFKKSGRKVMASMKKQYGADKGESVFYATANKKSAKPGQKMSKPKVSKKKSDGLQPLKTLIDGTMRMDTYQG
jgi:hypothetical protein